MIATLIRGRFVTDVGGGSARPAESLHATSSTMQAHSTLQVHDRPDGRARRFTLGRIVRVSLAGNCFEHRCHEPLVELQAVVAGLAAETYQPNVDAIATLFRDN